MSTILIWIIAALIMAVIVEIAERITRTTLPFGWLGNIVAGLLGGYIGQLVLGWFNMGQFGPELVGVYFVATFVGALIVILLYRLVGGYLVKKR